MRSLAWSRATVTTARACHEGRHETCCVAGGLELQTGYRKIRHRHLGQDASRASIDDEHFVSACFGPDSFGAKGDLPMGPAVQLPTDNSASELRRLARASKDARQSSRLLSLEPFRF